MAQAALSAWYTSSMIIIGHRGAAGLAPENTIAALMKAIEYSVDEIEIDVRVTKDNVPILHHNPNLIFPDDQKTAIKDHTFHDLQALKADLATLDEAITIIARQKPLIIEVKPDEDIQPIVAVIQWFLDRGWKPDDFRLASFSPDTLASLRTALPQIPLIVNERWSGVRAHLRARRLGASRITMNQRWLWFGFIRAVYRGGHLLSAYVINDPAKARNWKRFGMYGVITDFPDRFDRSVRD